MKKKFLALIDKDPELERLCSQIMAREHQLTSEVDFLQKRVQQMEQKLLADNKPDLDALVAHLESHHGLEGYDPERMHIEFSMEQNAVAVCHHSGGPGKIPETGGAA